MKMRILLVLALFAGLFTAQAAYQFNYKGNRGWLTFTGETTIGFDLSTTGKDEGKTQENFVDRGNGVADYGWYNMETGETGSFGNGLTATFQAGDSIGLYVTDNKGNTFISTKDSGEAELEGKKVLWGKADLVDGGFTVGGGNKGSNGTHEFYVFKINTGNASGQTPSGQPLPGIVATLLVGGGALAYLKKRKKLYKAE